MGQMIWQGVSRPAMMIRLGKFIVNMQNGSPNSISILRHKAKSTATRS